MPKTVPVPDLSRGGFLDLFRGFALPFRGFGLVFSTSRLSWLTLAVAGVTVVTLVLLWQALGWAAPALVEWAWPAPKEWWAQAIHWLLRKAAFMVGFVAGASIFPLLLAAPLMDPISIATEQQLGLPVTGEGGVMRTIKETLRALANAPLRLAVLLTGHLVLLPILLVPGIGSIVWSGLSWAWTAVWVTAAYLDVPMARHLYRFDQEVAVVRARPALCLGFGGAVALMLWIPLLNFFFVPVAVVGATLLFRGVVAARVIPPPTSDAPSP